MWIPVGKSDSFFIVNSHEDGKLVRRVTRLTSLPSSYGNTAILNTSDKDARPIRHQIDRVKWREISLCIPYELQELTFSWNGNNTK